MAVAAAGIVAVTGQTVPATAAPSSSTHCQQSFNCSLDFNTAGGQVYIDVDALGSPDSSVHMNVPDGNLCIAHFQVSAPAHSFSCTLHPGDHRISVWSDDHQYEWWVGWHT